MKKKFLHNSWVEFIIRWCLGLIFIYASFHKIADPAGFAKIIYGYSLFPGEIINLLAIVLPFIELVAGIALVSGFWPRSAAIIINGMLAAFMIAIAINLIRGHEFDCGCFSPGSNGQLLTGEQLLVRDIVWFSLGLFIIVFNEKRKYSVTD